MPDFGGRGDQKGRINMDKNEYKVPKNRNSRRAPVKVRAALSSDRNRYGESAPPPNSQEARDAARRENSKRRIQKAKRKQRVFYAIVLLMVVCISLVLTMTVFFKIESISIQGETRYSKEQIIESSRIKLKDNLFMSNMGQAEKNIVTELPYIWEAKVKRQFPSGIVIEVAETTPRYAMEDNGYILVDKNEKVLETGAEEIVAHIPVIVGIPVKDKTPGKPLSIESSEQAELKDKFVEAAIASKMDARLTVDLSDTLNIKVIYGDRLTLLFGTPTDMEYKFTFARVSIEKLPEGATGSLDLTASDSKKAVFSPRNAPGSSENAVGSTIFESGNSGEPLSENQ